MKIKHYLSLSALVLGLALTACGSKPAESKPEAPQDHFSEVTEFDEEIDVRTEDQKTFMEYDGDYAALTSSQFQSLFHTVPNESQSEAKTFTIGFEYDGEADKYEVELSLDEEFEAPMVFAAANGKATIQNLFVGSEYFYRIKAITGDDVDYSEVYTLQTADVLPRIVNVSGMTNCRDLGGKVTATGAKIKQGMIYRTASLDDNQSGSIIDNTGRETMLKQLKMHTEIDLRGGPAGTGGEGSASATATSKLNDPSVVYDFIPFAYSNGKDNLFRNIIPVRKFFECFEQEDCYPAFFHCRIGTDRTGLCATLLNGLLGLSITEIYQDYLFSNFGSIGKTSTVGQANEDGIAGYIRELREFEGATLQESVYNFLRTIGVKATTLQSILENCLEGELPAFVHKNIANIGVDKLGGDAAKTTGDTTFRMPSSHMSMTNGKKIELHFTNAKELKGSMYLNMSAKNTSSNLAAALEVTLDGNPITIKNTSFATTALGFGTNDWYWEPAKLVDETTIAAGTHTLAITNKISTEIKATELILNMPGAGEITIA